MSTHQIVFPDGQTLALPARTAAAIARAKAKYVAPLWERREEGMLKLGGHQWIEPDSATAARAQLAQEPAAQSAGMIATAWKLFGRDWRRAAAAYWADAERYPSTRVIWGRA